MAKTTIKVSCGCNRTFTTIGEAEAHVNATNHSMVITGSIKSDGAVTVNRAAVQGFNSLGAGLGRLKG